MKFIRRETLSAQVLVGIWCNLGSSLTVEMACQAGFDWLLIDLEHGCSDFETLAQQSGVAAVSNTASIVRIAWNEAPRFKRVLDLGVSGVMVPYVNTASEAAQAARSMRYPPEGVRGVAAMTRSTGFGQNFREYFRQANENLLTIVQVETQQAVDNAEEIASVPGVDVLFVGPLDLSVSLGVPQDFSHPTFRSAVTRVIKAAHKHRKQAGTLLAGEEQLEQAIADGYTFVALGSDSGLVVAGMRRATETARRFR